MKNEEEYSPLSKNPFVAARARLRLSQQELARMLNTSLYALVRWEQGDLIPSDDVLKRLNELICAPKQMSTKHSDSDASSIVFASSGIKGVSLSRTAPLGGQPIQTLAEPRASILSEIFADGSFWGDGRLKLGEMLKRNSKPAMTRCEALDEEISAGKNTYTYDAHTYHTKVPPQGIATVISKYLPSGGIVLDPFSGSGMTGVAARYLGYDVVLNELSPAASFISYNFLASIDTDDFHGAIFHILKELDGLQQSLYLTKCRECGSNSLLLYTIWSYFLECNSCHKSFLLWDHCRKYGNSVREHRILSKFPCPNCGREVNKSKLRRNQSVPVRVGYRCCSRKIVEHSLTNEDYKQIQYAQRILNSFLADVPQNDLPDGVNLNQPKRHGFDTVDKLYTPRNLVACAAIWREIRRITDPALAAATAFVFTSMYQRVTRLSEYRFWGGSGNMANFNVPHISNEANVFVTFERKAETIRKHLVATVPSYRGCSTIRTGSATSLEFLPDESIDFIFTDPPFGSNINYSEMNLLWESWLGAFTNCTAEAIVNRIQSKDIEAYCVLMTHCLTEAFRVLRTNHWMVLVFMNSSNKVWNALRRSIDTAGFSIQYVNIFDKQHGTFKQFVSENTAGADLMIHCQKTVAHKHQRNSTRSAKVSNFVKRERERGRLPRFPFVHVERETEIDYRTLYSRYVATAIQDGLAIVSFPDFREKAAAVLEKYR